MSNQQVQLNPKKSSRFKGVCLHKQSGKWLAYVKKDYKMKSLGLHVLEEDAARAYDAEARRIFGEFARLNFPEAGEDAAERLFQ